MPQEQMFTVGQTAKICQLSVQTLHFYDKIGLVKPYKVDEQNGYRYYSSQDILHIKIVQDLRSIQFSLEEIGVVLKSENIDSIPQIMSAKKAETLEAIQSLEQIVETIDRRMQHLEAQQKLRQEFEQTDVFVELKSYPDRFVAFERKRAVCGMECSIIRFMALFDRISEHDLTPDGHILTIYHENLLSFDRNDSDIEVCIPLLPSDKQPAFTRYIPGGDYISAVYSGFPSEEVCKGLYRRLLDWLKLHGYLENGPVLEQYLIDRTHMLHTDDFIVDLQIPVKKVLTL